MGEWEVRRGRTNATRKADDRTTAQRDHVGNVEMPTRAQKKENPDDDDDEGRRPAQIQTLTTSWNVLPGPNIISSSADMPLRRLRRSTSSSFVVSLSDRCCAAMVW